MAWVVLLLSGVFEAVWATALGKTNGFTEPAAISIFAVTFVLSMLGLGWAAKRIAIGTAYAVWTGLGAGLTVGYAMVTGGEPVSVPKLIFLAGIIVAVVGLRLLSSNTSSPT